MQTADVIVIGGGIAGISAAARLSTDAKVIVLEMEKNTCYHATGRSAAVFIRNYGNAVLRELNALSQEFLTEGDFLSRRGELLVALPDQTDNVEAHLEVSDTVERVDERAMRTLVPILREGRFALGAYERDAFDIDVDRLVQFFSKSLRENGGKVEINAEVMALSRQTGSWIAETKTCSYAAPLVINAAGAWADVVAIRAGLAPKGLQPLRRSAAIVPVDHRGVSEWPLVAGIAEDWYAKPESGHLMVSPADEDLVEPHDAWPDDLVLAHGIDRFERATTVKVKKLKATWAGLRTFASDKSPVVGFDGATEGFLWLAGQGGYGVQTSPALSILAADLCLGRMLQIGSTTLEQMSPNRF